MGEYLTAALVADDPTGMTWQWARSQDGEGGWEDIEAATSTKYIPTGDDVGRYLRATVSYIDGDGNTQSAEAITTDQVEQERSGVRCPWCEPEPIWTATPVPTVRPTATPRPTDYTKTCTYGHTKACTVRPPRDPFQPRPQRRFRALKRDAEALTSPVLRRHPCHPLRLLRQPQHPRLHPHRAPTAPALRLILPIRPEPTSHPHTDAHGAPKTYSVSRGGGEHRPATRQTWAIRL